MIRRCVICHQECGYNSKYCRDCGTTLRRNWSIAYKIKKKFGIRLCPMCFEKEIPKGVTFCPECKKNLKRRPNFIKKAKQWKDSTIAKRLYNTST